MRRLPAVAALLVVVLAGGYGLHLFRVHQGRERAEAACRAAVAADRRAAQAPMGTGGARVAVLGDSYARGFGLPQSAQAWPVLLAQQEGWTATVDGVVHTGFTNGGYCHREAFPARTAAVLAEHPDMVIVQGGLNDDDATASALTAAAAGVLRDLASVPTVIVVGPPDVPAMAHERAVDALLAAAAGQAHRRYVSALAWQVPVGPDRLHMTAAGHRLFAARVAAALR